MAAPYGSRNSNNKRLTVYESCKKLIESRKPVPQVCKSQNETPNFYQACKQYVERQQEIMKGNIDVKFRLELQSTLELFVENMGYLLQKLPNIDQDVAEKRSDSRFNKSVDANVCIKSQRLKMKLFACPKCDAKFENILQLGLHFKQNHLKNRGGKLVVLKSSEMSTPELSQYSNKRLAVYEYEAKLKEILESGLLFEQNYLKNRGDSCSVVENSEVADVQEAQNSTNKTPTVYACDSKYEEILESGLHLKQNYLENSVDPCGVLKSSEMTDPHEAENSINKKPLVYECDSRFGEILESKLQLEQNHLENSGGSCAAFKSSIMADSQKTQNSTIKIPTVCKCDAKFEDELESGLHFEQNQLENRSPSGVFKSSAISDLQEVRNYTNKRPTVYECDSKFEEILESELQVERHFENAASPCGVLKGSEMADPQETQISIKKRPTVYEYDAKYEEELESGLHSEQNHLENIGGLCAGLKISKMVDSHGIQNSTNKRLSVYESCKKIIEARNQIQKSLSHTNSSVSKPRKLVQQNCNSSNENSIFFQQWEQQQKRNESSGLNLFTCPNCDGKFEGEQKFAIHLLKYPAKKRAHLTIPVDCNLYPIKFPSEKDSDIHYQSHVVKCQQQKLNDKEVELQSSMEKISNKYDSFVGNMNSFLDKLPTKDQDLSKKKTDSRFLKENTETNSLVKSQNLKMYLFTCSKCDVKFEREHELRLHLQENHSEIKRCLAVPVECKLCQMKFYTKKGYANHFRSHVIENQQQTINDKEVELQSSMKKISNKFEMFAENMSSLLEELPTVLQDPLAKNLSSRFNKESTEKNFQLKSSKLFVCSKCNAKYEGEHELVLHLRVNHSNKRGRLAIPVKCKLCQNIFPSKKDYIIHFRTHSEKKLESPSNEKLCLPNVLYSSKGAKDKKPRRSVWDDCKKVLTEKSSQQVSSANSTCVVPKLPISKKVVFMNTYPDDKYFKTPPDKTQKIRPTVTNFRPIVKNVNYSSQNSIYCDCTSDQQLFSESKHSDDLQSDNLMYLKTEAMDVTETDTPNFTCNFCGISFQEINKFEAHHSTHLDDEFCQIREGDEELHVCNICGGCFTEINAFHSHILTHVKKELV
ncbi:unnamed protein product [Larinioides sclopetarius]|uniref:C2H2-type domain-containing protein n=1 Tax=Larinioides sclopetarius TaxID=280406 RepID=A0AAV2AN67_9ARAC